MDMVYLVLVIVLCLCCCAIIVYDEICNNGLVLSCLSAAILCGLAILFAVALFIACKDVEEIDQDAIIDQEHCRYLGAEVCQATDDKAVFIDINSGDLYAYETGEPIDETAQYLLTVDAETGEVLVVWQNVN